MLLSSVSSVSSVVEHRRRGPLTAPWKRVAVWR